MDPNKAAPTSFDSTTLFKSNESSVDAATKDNESVDAPVDDKTNIDG